MFLMLKKYQITIMTFFFFQFTPAATCKISITLYYYHQGMYRLLNNKIGWLKSLFSHKTKN